MVHIVHNDNDIINILTITHNYFIILCMFVCIRIFQLFVFHAVERLLLLISMLSTFEHNKGYNVVRMQH